MVGHIVRSLRFATLTALLMTPRAYYAQENSVKIEEQKSFNVIGLAVRTNNKAEATGQGEIPKLWQRFMQEGTAAKIPNRAEQNLIVWVNEYFGRVEHDGKQFADMKVFQDNEHRVFGTVAVVKRNQDTFGRDMEEMISRKLTFHEGINGAVFSIMTRQRLKVIERDLFEQLDELGIS